MEVTSQLDWHPLLQDPTGRRMSKPRTRGKTMVIDKGLGLRAFEDLLQTSGEHIDMIKIGFGSSPLYPKQLLLNKIRLAKAHNLCIFPGGTFLEVAVSQDAVNSFFDMVAALGFSGIEVSDGTIDMDRKLRNELIKLGVGSGLSVYTEYGKKSFGSGIDIDELIDTVHLDMEYGASLITIEGRESGVGVGIYDEKGQCKDDDIRKVVKNVPNPHLVMWEAPNKAQQVHLLKTLGPDINLGNIAPEDIMSVESFRRGLRSDTFCLGQSHQK